MRQKKQAKRCTKKARITIRIVNLLIVGPSIYDSSSLTMLYRKHKAVRREP
jgi:hypothetical protein